MVYLFWIAYSNNIIQIRRDAERLESGTTQPDTELTQALDAWIVRLDTVEQEKSATKKTTEDLMRETQEAERCRENLLKPVTNRE